MTRRQPWQRAKVERLAVVAPEARTEFDACIDLSRALAGGASVPSAAAVVAVSEAVRSLPGAGWIDVAWCASAPGLGPWLRLYRPGEAVVLEDDDCADQRARVEAIVAAAFGIEQAPPS